MYYYVCELKKMHLLVQKVSPVGYIMMMMSNLFSLFPTQR